MTQESTPEPLYHDPDLASFYDLENGWGADFDFCARLAESAGSVLDLGCGTGELAAHLAATRAVWGVDPSAAMLAQARTRPGGTGVTWVQGDGRSFRTDQRFDLILLTSHAFQCFLTDADQLAALRTIAHHLTPTGRFIFDMRNIKNRAWTIWNSTRTRQLAHPDFGKVTLHTSARFDEASEICTYTHHYHMKDGTQRDTTARIRFDDKSHLKAQIEKAGLRVDHWYGDWTGADWTPDAAEIIPLGGLA